MKLKDILKIAAPAVLGPMVGGLPFLSSIQNPFIRSALGTGIGSLAFGRKPKDALRDALVGGLSGGIMDGFGTEAAQATQASQGNPLLTTGTAPTPTNQIATTTPANTSGGTGIASVIGKGQALDAGKDLTMSGELLRSLNLAGEKEGNLLFKLLNTQMGEGIAAGLVAQLLAGDEEEPQGSYERRPFGEGGPGGQLGGIQYMKAGGEPDFFPRRNGGIDPSEGSGTKDDVPALLLAGEFVHTRDANEGLGKMMGAKNKDEAARMGIQAQYELMDAFERMA
jgi:hypothetical protein